MSESTAHGRQLLKEKICLTALRLFHKRGIRQVKMDDIATTLSVSKRTLYEIYTNKMELLAEVLELQNSMNHDRLKRELKPEANTMDVLILVLKISVEELNKISVEFLEDLHRYPEALQKLEELEKRSDEENRRFLQKGVEEGFFRIIKDQTVFYQQYGIKTVWTTLVRVFLRSICTLKGVQELDAFLDKMATEDGAFSPV